MKFICEIALSMWFASSFITLFFWACASLNHGRILTMPLPKFLYVHFCPVVHTCIALNMLQKFYTLREQRKRGV